MRFEKFTRAASMAPRFRAGRRRGGRCPIALLLALGCAMPVSAHDLSTIALLTPRSGCALGDAESVSIRNVNYGTAMPGASIFSMSYTINGGTPVTETVFMGNGIPPNGTMTYVFPTTADLSAPGDYLIDARITVPGDTNPGNDALGAQPLTNWAPTVGGSVSALPGPVSAGTLTLSGQTGAIVEWQQSLDGERWRSLENTTSTQAFSGIAQTAHFRVLVRNGLCAPAFSDASVVQAINIFSNGFEP